MATVATLPWALRSAGRAAGQMHYGVGESLGDLGGGLPINALLQGGWALKSLAVPGALGYLAYDQGGKTREAIKRHDFEMQRLAPFLRSGTLPYGSPLEAPDDETVAGYTSRK